MSYDIYFNLHCKTFSVRHKGKVIYHAPKIVAYDVTFVVNKAGQERVRRERKKNVHAFVRAKSISIGADIDTSKLLAVTYNPYKNDSFMCDGEAIKSSDVAFLKVIDQKPDVRI